MLLRIDRFSQEILLCFSTNTMIEVLSRNAGHYRPVGKYCPRNFWTFACTQAKHSRRFIASGDDRNVQQTVLVQKRHRICVLLLLCLSEFSRRFCVLEFSNWKALTAL